MARRNALAEARGRRAPMPRKGLTGARTARIAARMTPRAAAQAVRISQAYLGAIERGRARLSYVLARRLAAAYNCPIDNVVIWPSVSAPANMGALPQSQARPDHNTVRPRLFHKDTNDDQ